MTNPFITTLFSRLRSFNFWIFGAALLIFALGLTMLFGTNLGGASDGKAYMQALVGAIGAGAAFALIFFNYRKLFNLSWALAAAALLSLVSVLLFGTLIRGSRGWFNFGSFHIQPVEFAKLALLILLARFFSLRQGRKLSSRELLLSAGIVGVFVVPVLLQPDLGSAIVLLGLWFVFILVSASRWQIAATSLSFAALFSISWFGLLREYQKSRILALFFPQNDPQGFSYNVHQALLAIGSGGIFGQGLGHASISQLRFLPEASTDFLFAVLGESWGFVGIAALLSSFGFLLFILLRRSRMYEPFGSLLTAGFAYLLLLEGGINIGMNLGLLPVVGIGLPFFSYGGSSLFFHLLGLGIVESVIVSNAGKKG